MSLSAAAALLSLMTEGASGSVMWRSMTLFRPKAAGDPKGSLFFISRDRCKETNLPIIKLYIKPLYNPLMIEFKKENYTAF